MANLVKTEDFLALTNESMMELLKSDELKIQEIDLFLAVVRYYLLDT
jgi:hypothetical protein